MDSSSESCTQNSCSVVSLGTSRKILQAWWVLYSAFTLRHIEASNRWASLLGKNAQTKNLLHLKQCRPYRWYWATPWKQLGWSRLICVPVAIMVANLSSMKVEIGMLTTLRWFSLARVGMNSSIWPPRPSMEYKWIVSASFRDIPKSCKSVQSV